MSRTSVLRKSLDDIRNLISKTKGVIPRGETYMVTEEQQTVSPPVARRVRKKTNYLEYEKSVLKRAEAILKHPGHADQGVHDPTGGRGTSVSREHFKPWTPAWTREQTITELRSNMQLALDQEQTESSFGSKSKATQWEQRADKLDQEIKQRGAIEETKKNRTNKVTGAHRGVEPSYSISGLDSDGRRGRKHQRHRFGPSSPATGQSGFGIASAGVGAYRT